MKKINKTLVTVIFLFIITGCNEKVTNDSIITYAVNGKYGTNILSDQISSVSAGREYSMQAVLPKGASLKIILKGGLWFYEPDNNWIISEYNDDTQTQEFTVLGDDKTADLSIEFDGKEPLIEIEDKENVDGSIIMVEYYENGDKTPTKVKKLTLSTKNKTL